MTLKNKVIEAVHKSGTSAGAKLGWLKRPHANIPAHKLSPQQREESINWAAKNMSHKDLDMEETGGRIRTNDAFSRGEYEDSKMYHAEGTIAAEAMKRQGKKK